jgi:hypothetical protein
MNSISLTAWGLPGVLALMALFLGYWVHVSLIKHCYLWHARRFCRRNNLEILRWQAGYCFEESQGRRVKTELTAMALDCRGSHGERRVVNLLVWVFGVKVAYGFPGFPVEPGTAPNGGPALSVIWERGSGPPP